MKIDYKLLAALGLLIFSAVVILRQSGQPHQESVGAESAEPISSRDAPKLAAPFSSLSPQVTRSASRNEGPAAGNSGNPAAGSTAGNPTVGFTNGPTAGPIPSPQFAPSSPSSAVNSPAPGFQLADDVQLPAVILALSAAEKDPKKKVSEPIAAAMRGIVDRFYQDLAESARGAAAGADPAAAPETGMDSTVIIQKGPAVDRARARANETYRALFGIDAFNRMTMDALLESQLPVDAGSEGK